MLNRCTDDSPIPTWLMRWRLIALASCAVLVTGCAGYQAYREGQNKLAEGQAEAGLVKLREAMESDPSNTDYRRSYFTQKEITVNGLLRQADLALAAGDFTGARQSVEQINRVDPGNPRVTVGLERIAVSERHAQAIQAASGLARDGKLDSAVTKVQQVLSESPNNRPAKQLLRQLQRQQADVSGKELGIYPKLKSAFRIPVTLSFTNATLLQVLEALKNASGLNYMIERDVKPDLRVTLSVVNKPVEDILRLLLATNQLERRILDENTLLIYPNTPAKATEYREMVVRSFYLSNAEAAKVSAAVKAITKARDVVVDEKLNMLMVRDSEDIVRLAEKVIAAQDIPEPEVMLELEVMEVSVSRLLDMGIQWPTTLSASVVGADGIAGQLRLSELRNRTLNSSNVNVRINDPLVAGQLKSQVSDATLLANPRVRVRNKQSAKILIGERVPVITTTATANVGTSQSISYLDVGLKLDIEPTISLDDEVSMKIALEVSNIAQTITLSGGTQAYRLGTRNTSTSLQVHDGETNVLAGLIQRDRSHSNTGVPGFNELPVVNRLFGMTQDNDHRTEIVLLITPHIVRTLDLPGLGQQEFLSGTDAASGASPIQLGQPAVRTVPSPAVLTVPSTAPGSVPLRPSAPASSVIPPSAGQAAPPVGPASVFSSPGTTPERGVPLPPPALTQPGIVPSSPQIR